MKKKAKMNGTELSKMLGISKSRGVEAVMKAQLIRAVLDASKDENMTHAMIAERANLPRSAVTGILSGSLQKVTIDRILRLVEAVGLEAEIKIKKGA